MMLSARVVALSLKFEGFCVRLFDTELIARTSGNLITDTTFELKTNVFGVKLM